MTVAQSRMFVAWGLHIRESVVVKTRDKKWFIKSADGDPDFKSVFCMLYSLHRTKVIAIIMNSSDLF